MPGQLTVLGVPDMKALQSSLGKGVRGRGKQLTENFHNHSNKPSRSRGSLISGKRAYERGVGLNAEGGIFREGGGGSIREHLNNEGLQKKRGLKAHQKGRIIKGVY